MVETLFAGAGGADEVEETPVEARRLVAFEIGGELFGVAITDVAEIREPTRLTPVPHVPPHILGLINLRGAILPVVDLRGDARPDDSANAARRLVVLKGREYQVALNADAVLGIARVPRADFRPAPSGVARLGSEFYEAVVMVDGRMLTELSVERLLDGTSANARGGEDA